MIPSTVERVPQHTAAHINEQIRRRTEQNVARFAADPTAIEDRLAELDQEWDIERTLEANAATVSLIGLALGAAVDRRFFVLPGEEDFGIAPVESQAAGRPVLAFARGGALETVVVGETGVFFPQPTVESLLEGIAAIDRLQPDPIRIHEHAKRFDVVRFGPELRRVIEGCLTRARR